MANPILNTLLAGDTEFGDLTLHLLVSAAIVFGLYVAKVPLKIAILVALVAGLGKELFDASQEDNAFDAIDLGADWLGALLGAGGAALFRGYRFTKGKPSTGNQQSRSDSRDDDEPPKKPKVLKVRH